MKLTIALSAIFVALATSLPAVSNTNDISSTNITTATFSTTDALLPPSLSWDSSYKFDGGVAASGNSHITFSQTGTIRFKTHFHDSGALGYNYAISCALRDSQGHVFSLSRKGKIHGTFDKGSRNSDKDETKTDPRVRANWGSIVQSQKMHCKVKMNWNVAGLLGEVVDLVKKYGPIVGEVIALF
jgi:hypothetical protein